MAAILPVPLGVIPEDLLAHRASGLDSGLPVDLVAVLHPVFNSAGIGAEAPGFELRLHDFLSTLRANWHCGNLAMSITKGFHRGERKAQPCCDLRILHAIFLQCKDFSFLGVRHGQHLHVMLLTIQGRITASGKKCNSSYWSWDRKPLVWT
jgi:hypothetical protein